MNSNKMIIAFLTASAFVLLMANFLVPTQQATGNLVLKDRDYLVSTARVQNGDALYVVDNRTGQMAVFVFDPAARRLVPRDVRPVSDAFVGR